MDNSKQQSPRQKWRGTQLGCPAPILQYPEIEQCFNPREVTCVTTRQKLFSTGQRLDHAFAFSCEFSIPCVERQTPSLTEPYIRSIVERKVPRVRQHRNLRCVKIHHTLNDQLFPCRQKSIHQILRHPASSDLLQQNMSEFIPPENGSNPFGIHFQQALDRPLHLGVSNKEICHHRAIDNNHGENLPSPLTRRKVYFSNNAVKDNITFAPHQLRPVFLPRSKSFAVPSSARQPARSFAWPDFLCLPAGYQQPPRSAPRSPLGSRSVDSSSRAPSKPHAGRRAHFVWSMSACPQTDIIMTANQLLFP